MIEASLTGAAIEDEGESKALEEILRQKAFLERLVKTMTLTIAVTAFSVYLRYYGIIRG